MRYRRLRAQVKDLLCELCTSEAEVAATLRSAGVRAAPLDGQQCAVALYLKAVSARRWAHSGDQRRHPQI